MGSLRRGLILGLFMPTPALAEVCDEVRPGWDGAPATAWSEALFLAGTVPVLVLILASAVVFRFRSQWGGLVVVVLWTILITLLSMIDPGGLRAVARAEGCVGSLALFIAAAAAICVAIILYTAPIKKRSD